MSAFDQLEDVRACVAERLSAKGFPVAVEIGPCPQAHDTPKIRLTYDTGRADAFGPPPGASRNPEVVGRRDLALVAHVVVRSTLEGASFEDHASACQAYVDALLCALVYWVKAGRAGAALDVTEARFVDTADQPLADPRIAATYALAFSIPRAVRDVTFEQASAQQVALGAHAIGTTRVQVGGRDVEVIE